MFNSISSNFHTVVKERMSTMSSKASHRRPRLNSCHGIMSGGKITRVRAVMCANRRSHTGPQMSKKKEDQVPSTVRGARGQIKQLPPHTPLDGLGVSLSPCLSPPTFHHPGHPSHAVNLLSSLSLLPFLSFLAAPVHPTPPPNPLHPSPHPSLIPLAALKAPFVWSPCKLVYFHF